MNTDAHIDSLLPPEQFRMARLQVYNWGTFSKLHDIPIAEQGFLFVGRSGAGKSTLLDAFSALLVPPRWVDFNAAAREAERSGRDRNLVSYIRGAWAEQGDNASGAIATQYLRSGTTWSAIALTYRNTLDRFVVLVQVYWLRGNANGAGDVKRHFMIFERPFDLGELDTFGQSNLDVRKLKQQFPFPGTFHSDKYSRYGERFCRLLGIDNEMALRLLHKTQSAKNLGDLNTFLREFMLDKPQTFDVADRLVAEFDDLNAAHQAVVTARQQVETLTPAREGHQQREVLLAERGELNELLTGIDSYTAHRRMGLLGEQIEQLNVKASGLEGEIGRQQAALDQHTSGLRDLERQHREAGGGQVEAWQAEKSGLEQQREQCQTRRGRATDAIRQLGWGDLPDSPHRYAELVGDAKQVLDQRESDSNRIREQRDGLVIQKQAADTAFKHITDEVKALERQTSNIPAQMLSLRQQVAAAIGVAESALPFAGELVQVKADEGKWQGAIERVLRSFAFSLLVDERHYAALSEYINSNHLQQRLVYYRTAQVDSQQVGPVGTSSLALKLDVKPCSQAEWLRGELRRRFDYACVDSMQSFRRAERALTREGHVKHSHTQHEKDDRSAIDDRLGWVLGFDNQEKLKLCRQQAQVLGGKAAELEQQITALTGQGDDLNQRASHCQTLVNLQWGEVDLAPLLANIERLQRQILAAQEGNQTLRQVEAKIEQQKQAVEQAEATLRKTTIKHERLVQEMDEHKASLKKLQDDPAVLPLMPAQQQGLDDRFAALKKPVQLDTLDSSVRSVERSIRNDVDEVTKSITGKERVIERCFDTFIREWPSESGGNDATLAAADDFFAILTRLETDGLPDYEQRFFELLNNQSNQNLAELSTYLSDERKKILERMDLVNESLSKVPFNQSADQRTFLRIVPSELPLPDVLEFKREIKQTLSHAWQEDRKLAESRFESLRRLVVRLASQKPEDRRWRDTVLDVRQHTDFIGREADEHGVEVEVYRSGSGKSGGQRQKLATTCLAAALRYQLGGNEHGTPMYAPVVLDEAFDKADNEFTTLAMKIFENFGFQMIVATPLKSVMTLEPFIGGACFIDIRDRNQSSVLLIEYDSDRRRLNLPERGEPGVAEPAPVESAAAQPNPAQPDLAQPGTARPGASEPGASEPGASEPGAVA